MGTVGLNGAAWQPTAKYCAGLQDPGWPGWALPRRSAPTTGKFLSASK